MKKTAILWVGADDTTKKELALLLPQTSGWTVDFSDSAETAVEHACADDYAGLLLGKDLAATDARKLQAVFRAHGSEALILSAQASETVESLWDRIRAAVTQKRVEHLRKIHVQDDGFSNAMLPIGRVSGS